MKQKHIFFFGRLGILLFFIQPGIAHYKIVTGAKNFYFGHISYVEVKHDGRDPVVFREGQTRPEVALLNLPLGPGDVIQTSDARRCEIQFDNGTIVRLDFNTELKIETILAPSLSTAKKVSNLLLAQGQVYVMSKKYDSLEIFQIITPLAAAKLGHHTIAMIGISEAGTDVQVERGKAQLLYGPDKSHLLEAKVEAKERTLITADHQAKTLPVVAESDFARWNTLLNENFRVLHEGSFLPKPIQRLPKAIFYFAQRYGNLYGEWLWHPLYGYVWRPYYNDSYPWGTWHPLYYGSWTVYQGELFWIPEEPWGWVPYHLGIWMWDPKKGWLWLPGSMFAPAWAVWDFYYGYYSWRAWSLFDWYFGPSLYWPMINSGFYYRENIPSAVPPGSFSPEVLRTVRKDQLQKKKSPAMPIPKEMNKILKTALKALERGDESVLSSLREIPRQAMAVRKEDLASSRIPEKAICIDRALDQPEAQGEPGKNPRPAESSSVSLEARRALQRHQAIAELEFRALSRPEDKEELRPSPFSRENFFSSRTEPLSEVRKAGRIEAPVFRDSLPSSAPPSFRFRDWNPDVKTAVAMGVRIFYSSRTNEVTCPELGLASRAISLRTRVVGPSFGSFPASGGAGVRGGESATTSSGATSAGTHGSSGTSRSGSAGSRGGGEAKKN